ncbi:LysR family transcriptional regulator, hydrogen peroxide-inducible genes activator [Cohaesibacter sp. ES.047]|uniref:hydrogen peroxide-inducible genes activator n=1 Tax=Cohaesibacter sp. ES.047 TaxID=1798205 RepID=UPI000BB87D00|nr:hydrogen peroxide-inducible genes activator [Cohaesibacter sp. ES.047]SNY90020.1 LysR family transcriptional regulator, hydrogen peroxide-inducible genes activator [Cohaesibacter sp. ES.047]
MNKFSMKHLRYFDALARLGHFGRAAESCSVTQPALSVQIKELEELIGAPLVERNARKIHLTSLGSAFAERVQGILQSVDELEDLVRASNNAFSGQFRFGVIPTVAPYMLSDIIKQLTLTFPALDLRPREAKTQKLVRDILDARLEAAIVALPISEPSLHEELLFEEDFVLLRSEADSDKPVPAPERLTEMRLLLLEEGHCFRDQAISYCSTMSSLPRNLMEGSSLSTLVQMVGAGIGVTLIPQMAVPVECRSAAVSVARLPEPQPSRAIGMVWRKSNPLQDQLKTIADLIRTVGLSQKSQ